MSDTSKTPEKKGQGIGHEIYPMRIVGYLVLCAELWLTMYQKPTSTHTIYIFWIAYFFFYPHIIFQIYRYFHSHNNIERTWLILDLFWIGIVIVMIDFSLMPTMALIVYSTATCIGIGGIPMWLKGIAALGISLLLMWLFWGSFELTQESNVWSDAIGFVYMFLGFNAYNFAYYRRSITYKNIRIKIEKQTIEIAEQKEEIEQQHEKLEDQNKLLEESIKRAEFIQKAILRPESEIQKELKIPIFIFLEPHSKVSGDFYWCGEVNEKKIIIAADCTGHGIPGAMISMIGYDILNQIINLHQITQADKILSQLDEEISKVFHQYETNKEDANHDGMDISICIYDPKNDILEYGGAKQGLIYIQDNVLQEIKPNKVEIGGGFKYKKIFESHQIALKGKDTMIYLSSDGYQDQFGGKENKKFMRARLKKLFLQLNSLPLSEQKKHLGQAFYDWKANRSQTDDVLIMGFRLNSNTNFG